MKFNWKRLTASLFLFVFSFVLLSSTSVAQNATAYTYTISPQGEYIRTQDAYLPGSILFKDIQLNGPEDMYIRDDKLYVADTGNKRILVYDLKTAETKEFGADFLQKPTGVFVNENHEIYVADYSAKIVYRLAPDGTILQQYGRPTEKVYGTDTTFLPKKVVSNKAGDVYIISEGGYDGVVSLNRDGKFMGYFGFNYTNSSLWSKFVSKVFSERQKAKVMTQKPNPFNNLTIDNNGIVYTVTQGIKENALKKHDISGANMIRQPILDEANFTGVSTGRYGQIYAVTLTGLIFEYDSNGMLLYSFGGKAVATERAGYFTTVSDIASDNNDCLYILDRERGLVHVFYPTEFVTNIHKAIGYYENGDYEKSRELWQDILRQSGTSKIAYEYLSKTYFQTQNYALAAKYARIAEDRSVYSDAFWEIRNKWLLDYTGFIILAIAGLAVLLKVYKLVKPKRVDIPVSRVVIERKNNSVWNDILMMKRFIRHPIDSFYYVKRGQIGTVSSAVILYLVGFVVFFANFFLRGFVFNHTEMKSESSLYALLLYLVPLFLWVTGNYLVSSINEGEGSFRSVFIATAYSLTPLILLMPFITLSTYIFTLNEAFVVNMATTLAWVWCGVIMVLGLMEIHDYTLGQVVKNILMTLFFMAIVVIVASIVYMFWDHLFDFVYSLFKEVAYRVIY